MTLHLLSWLLVIPALSALVVLILPRPWERTVRRFSIGAVPSVNSSRIRG